MVNVRGVNVYPASIEAVVRRFGDVVEFRSIVSRSGAMRTLRRRDRSWRRTPQTGRRAPRPWPPELREALGLTVPVDVVEAGIAPAIRDEGQPFHRGGVGQFMATTGNAEVDVVVIGGGPAGSTVSTLIAQQGPRVALFERERFPRFHIGESLIPETYWVLKRLNMLPKMQASPFVKKYSVQFVNSAGRESAPFYFWDNKPHECSQTWQVVRSQFDQMMLDNAREHGVDAREGVRVHDVLFDGDRAVGVTIKDEDGTLRDVRAKVVVDASGQNGLLMNRLGLRVWDPDPEQGRDLDVLEGRLPRHRSRRGRDAGDPDQQQEGVVLVHPAARRCRQRRRGGAV